MLSNIPNELRMNVSPLKGEVQSLEETEFDVQMTLSLSHAIIKEIAH